MMNISRRQFLSLAGLALSEYFLVGCTESQKPATDKKTETVTPPDTFLLNTSTPTPDDADTFPRGNVPREQQFVWMSSYGGPEFHDYGLANVYAGASHQFSLAAGLEPLLYYSAFDDKVYPWLAESWLYNDDATEVTIRIRKGITWSDGVPFTAKDIVFTITMLISYAPKLWNSAAFREKIKDIILVDDYMVRITLNQPDYRFIYNYFAFRFGLGTVFVPEHIFKDVEDVMTFPFYDPEKGWPVVTGGYQLVEFEPLYKKLDLRHNWWAVEVGLVDNPDVKQIVHQVIVDMESAALSIINKEIDTCLTMQPHLIKHVIDQAPHVITHTKREKPYGYIDWWPVSIYFNTLEYPYNDKRVRWAMAYAIDQQQMIDIGWLGCGEVLTIPYPRYKPLEPYFEATSDLFEKMNFNERNLDKTVVLMLDAGFSKDADGFWVDRDGIKPDANMYADAQFFGSLSPIVTEHLREAGFMANHLSPPDVWYAMGNGSARLHWCGHGGSVADPFITLEHYHRRHITPTGEYCGMNRSRWSNPEVDRIIEEMDLIPMGDPKLVDLFRQAIEIWLDELPEIPLTQFYHWIPMNTTYWDNWPTEDNPYVNGAAFHITFPMLLWNLKAKP